MKAACCRALFISAIFLMMVEIPRLVLAQTPTPPRKFDKSFVITEEIPILYYPDSTGWESTSSPQATMGLEDWSRIVFQSFRDGNLEIYFGPIDGQNPVNITNHPDVDARPVLNRGGTQIAFNSNRDGNYEIYIVNVDGSGLTRLTYNTASDYAPAWSPDGNKIVFASESPGNIEIYTINKDGSGLTRLTNHSYDDFGPIWSPDGNRIAWIRYHNYLGSIWVMNADGTNPRSITGSLQYLNNVAWSPDGSHLAADCDYDLDEWNELVWMNIDGTSMHEIYDASQVYVDSYLGSWSPDSQWIIFTRIEFAVEDDQLYIAHAYLERIKPGDPSTDHSRLIGSGYDELPDWQTLDIIPPRSSVHPLPVYSRIGGVPVAWSGIDSGESGLSSYDVQFRINSPGNWFNWVGNLNTTKTSDTIYYESPGDILYFRSRARDRSGNLESWPAADGDSWTRLFSWILETSIIDNREKPIPDPALQISPSPWETLHTDYLGNFLYHLTTSEPHTLLASHAGYGALPVSTLLMDQDTAYELVLPPPDNLIMNGGFEAGTLDPWQVDGAAQAEVYNPESHSGSASLRIGYPPDFQITNLSNSSDISGFFGHPQIVRDPQGTLHAVWHDMSYFGLVYSQKPPDGDWTSPALITPGNYYDLAVGPDGTLHLVCTTSANTFYASKPLDGEWSSPSDISGDFTEPSGYWTPTIAVDGLGNVHVMWGEKDDELNYATKPHGASWSPPVSLPFAGWDPELAVGKDNTLHLIWRDLGGLLYSNRPLDGTWSEPFQISSGTNIISKKIRTDDAGNIYLCWENREDHTIKYAWKDPSGNWSAPVILAQNSSMDFTMDLGFAVEPGGFIHLAWSLYYGKIYYQVRYPDGLWSKPLLIRDGGSSAPALSAGNNGRVHMVWFEDNPYYTNTDVFYTTFSYPESIDFNMSQSVQISAGMHKPTLSFAYRIEPYDGSGAYLELSMGDTPVITATQASQDWDYAWADLSAWSGQTITLTIASHGTSTSGYTSAQIDEISLGSWSTPIVTGVSPSRLDEWSSVPITVTGENFLTTPIIYLNDVPIPGVTMPDEHTLHANIPPELPAGIYDVWVENPEGQRGAFHSGLVLGQTNFLPLLVR